MATPIEYLTKQRNRLAAELASVTAQIAAAETRETELTAELSEFDDAIEALDPE